MDPRSPDSKYPGIPRTYPVRLLVWWTPDPKILYIRGYRGPPQYVPWCGVVDLRCPDTKYSGILRTSPLVWCGGLWENFDRRLEAAHFEYAALRVTSWYPDTLSFGADLSDFILNFTSLPKGIPPQVFRYTSLTVFPFQVLV